MLSHVSLQKLEDSVLKDTTEIPPLRGSPPTKVPAKVRQIVTSSLSTEDLLLPQPGNMAAPNVDTLQEENRMLQAELNRIDDLLATTRAERDEIGIKYNAIAERVSPTCSSYVLISALFSAHFKVFSLSNTCKNV